jgi:hypothetical protein
MVRLDASQFVILAIPILAIHPDWDPDFSNPSQSGNRFY